ncbi:hypothetical protein IG631_21488 [Alternaria alternata]|nr:hypothetical protein IG631_21488 [Alternaria alternata]
MELTAAIAGDQLPNVLQVPVEELAVRRWLAVVGSRTISLVGTRSLV